uniref:PRC domain-containing protein n=1 Tax=Loa loa TaxID=7209 RepID=A0A1I7VTK2_LOALO
MRELRVVTTNESDEVVGIIGRKADGTLPFKILVEVKSDSSVPGIATAGVLVAAERLRIVTTGRSGMWILEDNRSSLNIAELAEASLVLELTEIGGVHRTVATGVPE